MKLRVYFNENPENELIIAKEFLIRHGIYDKEYLALEKLSNFIYFIKSDDCLKINPSRALKDLILDGCHYGTEDNNMMDYQEENLISDHHSMNMNNLENNNENVISENNANPNNSNLLKTSGNFYSNNKNSNNNINLNNNTNLNSAGNNSQTDLHNFNLHTHNKFFNNFNFRSNPNINGIKPSTSQSVKMRNNLHNNICNNNVFSSDERTNASMHPILNEKIYKIEYSNPKAVIDNLEPEIAKIKGLSINLSQKKVKKKRYEMGINNMKKNKKKLNEEVSTSGQLPLKDIEHIKKKNKLLEYIVLQRSKNRLKLENDKKVFELEYNGSITNTNEINGYNNMNSNFNKSNSLKVMKKHFDGCSTKSNFFPKISGGGNTKK